MNTVNTETKDRLSAIDPHHSFIVQAPAGSGKTELLTQRYLRLLSSVSQPEEVVAITFTRKAASEMRERVLNALNNLTEAQSEHQKLTQSLASQVRLADQINNWHLAENPNRLRILTIDALCAQLANQMPLLSRLAPQAKITENARNLYEKAIYALFNRLDENSDLSDALTHLLLAMDNRAEILAELLMGILAQREQWLGLLMAHYRDPEGMRIQLEQGLKQVINESLTKLSEKLPTELKHELFLLLQLAGTHLLNSQDSHPLCLWLDLEKFPEPESTYQTHWHALAKLLLTEEQTWRKSFDKRQGFPSEAKDKQTKEAYKRAKESIKALTQMMTEDESIHASFCDLLNAPSSTYTNEQWTLLKEIIRLLPQLVAELNLVFQAENSIDFVELSLSALRALGNHENPTDLALYLDYQIKHLLIDEFQDTSLTQFKLIEQLITHWQPNDGKSLFLVGDPMQSIYRFRNAEVGLFLRVQQQGISNLKLNSIQLKHNFRSDPKIIDWINQSFAEAFPKNPEITAGAVPYFSSHATKETQANAGVYYHPTLSETADTTLELVQKYRSIDPKASIAILVRSRTQLQEIIPHLKNSGIHFKAVELEVLSTRIEVEDLFSLTRALSHFADRTAWLAILRAPWCALSLADLLLITQHAEEKPLWYSLNQFQEIPNLSEDAKLRLTRCVSIWKNTLATKNSYPLAEWIKNCWLELNGPACLDHEQQLKNTEAYFELLRQMANESNFSLNLLKQKLNQLYAEPNPEADDQLQVMTIHKAKGLEFDHVILPHLESSSANESTRLLRWLERPRLTQDSDLILAPFKTPGTEKEAIYDYLLEVEKRKLEYESLRLLYVAASRSKISLHLIFELELDEKGQAKKPDSRSFIKHLWPHIQHELKLDPLFESQSVANHVELSTKPRALRRLASTFLLHKQADRLE